MSVKTDIQIAREANKKPIQEIGEKLGIPTEHLLPYGHDKAKIGQDFIESLGDRKNGKLILVTPVFFNCTMLDQPNFVINCDTKPKIIVLTNCQPFIETAFFPKQLFTHHHR